jgi:hypothetical protein
MADLTGYEYEKSFLNAGNSWLVLGALKLKLPHENGGVPFNP